MELATTYPTPRWRDRHDQRYTSMICSITGGPSAKKTPNVEPLRSSLTTSLMGGTTTTAKAPHADAARCCRQRRHRRNFLPYNCAAADFHGEGDDAAGAGDGAGDAGDTGGGWGATAFVSGFMAASSAGPGKKSSQHDTASQPGVRRSGLLRRRRGSLRCSAPYPPISGLTSTQPTSHESSAASPSAKPRS